MSILLNFDMKKEPKPGDLIRVKTNKETLDGVYMPGSDKKKVILKFNSGYNVGINRKNIKSLKVIKKYLEKKVKLPKIKHKKGLKNIAILHTGGTVASQVDYKTGGVTPRFSPEDLVNKFPEITDIVNLKDSKLIRNMFSEDMNFKHYNLIDKEILKENRKVDGIIITHGTDTMHYTSAALSFILEDLNMPVILVGSQRSSDRGSSDAALNLICSCHFIANTDFAEVAICMHENMDDDNCLILPGVKSRKLHSSRRDAFKAVNTKPWARVSKKGIVTFLKQDYRRIGKRTLKLKLFKDLKVGILRAHPNMKAVEVRNYKNFDGLVLEGTGLGHFPIGKVDNLTNENTLIYEELKKLTKKMPVVVSTQTIFGRINLNVYSTGRSLLKIGILGNLSDMTTETTFIKIGWLLSNYDRKEIGRLITENLRGEISDRIEKDFL